MQPVGREITLRLARELRSEFRRQRAARIGPDLSHRRTIVARVLRTRAVRVAAVQQARDKKQTRRAALLLQQRLFFLAKLVRKAKRLRLKVVQAEKLHRSRSSNALVRQPPTLLLLRNLVLPCPLH